MDPSRLRGCATPKHEAVDSGQASCNTAASASAAETCFQSADGSGSHATTPAAGANARLQGADGSSIQ